MLTLLKNCKVYTPDYIGTKDILISGKKIAQISDSIVPGKGLTFEFIDINGKYLVPGFIDQHVHLAGGGGEAGFGSRIPELNFMELLKSGITTAVGLLGSDSIGRNLENLLFKARELEEKGITTFIHTGAYEFPSPSITGSIKKDICLIDKVIGVKVALSDHRASHISSSELTRLASELRQGGLLSGKGGRMAVHVGNGKEGLSKIFEVIKGSDIPVRHFLPTHLNRNMEAFSHGIQFAKLGGYIDFTTKIEEFPASRALVEAVDLGVPLEQITFSSDGNGSKPFYDEQGFLIRMAISKFDDNLSQFKKLFFDEKLSLDQALKPLTSNPANALNIYPKKGGIIEWEDADMLVLDEKLDIEAVILKGNFIKLDSLDQIQ